MTRRVLALLLLLLPAAQAWAQLAPFPGSPQVPPTSTATAGGTNLQLQYNNAGVLGGLTDVQVTARIQQFSSSLSGAVPASGGGTTNFLRADGTWAVPAGGSGGGVPGGSNLQVQYNNAGSFGGLTDAALTARIVRFTGALSGSVPASGGGTANFLRADGTWAVPASAVTGNTGLWNDQSAVLANGGNLVSNASRFNHLLVGEMSTMNAGFSSSPKSWLDQLPNLDNAMVGSQIASTSTIGTSAFTGAARTSDERTALGGPSGGSAGGYFFGVADDNPGTDGPIALGANLVGIHRSGSGITLGAQMDINSAVATCQPTPDSPMCSSAPSTIGMLITAGAFSGLATQDIGSAIVISGGATQRYKTGIIIDASSIRSGVGPTILGSASTVAIGMPWTHQIIWYGAAGSASSAIWGGSSGNLNLFATNVISINGVAAVNCPSGINAGSTRVIAGIVTAC